MQLTALYHPIHGLMVTDDEEEFDKLMASGVWFDHPNKAKDMRDKHEKQIRQEPRKRLNTSKRASKKNGRDA